MPGATPKPLRTSGIAFVLITWVASASAAEPIKRHALVTRHNPRHGRPAPEAPLSVGNGEFAFTFDVTGLLTFPVERPGDVPLGSMSQWAWHEFHERGRYRYELTLRDDNVHGRQVSYAAGMTSDAARAIRSNPHRFSLGRIALRLTRADGSLAELGAEPLDRRGGQPLLFRWRDGHGPDCRHPESDAAAVSIDSPLLASGRLAIELSFAYPLACGVRRLATGQNPIAARAGC